MNPSAPESPIEALITVKAYPQPSKKTGESVCIAGVLLEPGPSRFVRLYPVDFRGLPGPMQFKKYDIISCIARRPNQDARPESLCPIRETIERVGRVRGWEDRGRMLEPLRSASMCEIYERQRHDGTSLGLFRPRSIDDLIIEDAAPWDDGRVAIVNQGSLLEATRRRPLEQIPFKFSFVYTCDDPRCNGHKMSTIDWEVAEQYRKTRGRPREERLQLVKQRWLEEVCGPGRDPSFFVGNLNKRHSQFVVVGVFWPPRVAVAPQLQLALS